jgi:hypothetical protein
MSSLSLSLSLNPVITTLLLLLPHRPFSYTVPLFLLVPALSVGLNTFLLPLCHLSALLKALFWTTLFTYLLLLLPLVHRPSSYTVPLFPFVPALSVGLNTFLLGQLDRDAYIRFGIWTVAVTGAVLGDPE